MKFEWIFKNLNELVWKGQAINFEGKRNNQFSLQNLYII